MPEGSDDAAILIATSFQALSRSMGSAPDTLLSDCTVLILFAGFFVEASLNYIFKLTLKETELIHFPRSRSNLRVIKHPGMRDKLRWFYNEFITHTKANNWNDIDIIDEKLEEIFPGFLELYTFRNDICHGKINQSAKSRVIAERLRKLAKEIVDKLYDLADEKGYIVPRLVTYQDALSSLGFSEPMRMSDSSSTG